MKVVYTGDKIDKDCIAKKQEIQSLSILSPV